jgi:hypothetical protein
MADLDINAKFTAGTNADNDSRKWMIYTADDDTEYAVFISEAIGEVLGFGDVDGATDLPQLPNRFSMRRIFAQDSSSKVKQSFPVGTADQAIYGDGGTVKVARKGKADGLVLNVTGSRGESRTFVTGTDTGQTGGDAT